MKKLNLEMLRLTSKDVLERSQMGKITGGGYGNGYGGRKCWVSCPGFSYDVDSCGIGPYWCDGGLTSGPCQCS